MGGEVRVVFSFWNTCSQSLFHVNLTDLLSSWMMGCVCSASLGRKWEMAVRRPMRRCTSLILLGLRISMIALHFSGLASMSRWAAWIRGIYCGRHQRRICQGWGGGCIVLTWKRLWIGPERVGDGLGIWQPCHRRILRHICPNGMTL